jgi:hypothetical protein
VKIGQDRKVEFRKSFKLYRQILVRDILKVDKKLSILYGIDKSERNTAIIFKKSVQFSQIYQKPFGLLKK